MVSQSIYFTPAEICLNMIPGKLCKNLVGIRRFYQPSMLPSSRLFPKRIKMPLLVSLDPYPLTMFSIKSLPKSLLTASSLYFIFSSLQNKLVMWKDFKYQAKSFWITKLYTLSKPPKISVCFLNFISPNPSTNLIGLS